MSRRVGPCRPIHVQTADALFQTSFGLRWAAFSFNFRSLFPSLRACCSTHPPRTAWKNLPNFLKNLQSKLMSVNVSLLLRAYGGQVS